MENEVTIHYKTPVRQEIKEALSEDELQRRQAEHMKKVYQEERRRKYLQVSQSLDGSLNVSSVLCKKRSPGVSDYTKPVTARFVH